MASRVNVRFIIVLSVILVATCTVVVYGALKILTRSGDNYVAMGDKAYQEGDFKVASEMYGRAVGHDRTRTDWLEKWLDALTQSTPETTPEYDRAYNEHYIGILSQLATLQDTSYEAQRRFLEATYQRTFWANPTARGWESFSDQTDARLARLDPEAPETKALKRYRGLAGLAQMRQFEPSEPIRQRTLADLRDAFAGDQEDVEVSSAIALWYFQEWQRARRARRLERAAELQLDMDAQIASLQQRFPDSLEAQLTALEIRVSQEIIRAETLAGQRVAARRFEEDGKRLVQIALGSDPSRINGVIIERLGRLLLNIRAEEGHQNALRVIDHALAARPDDAHLLVMKGISEMRSLQGEKAIESFQQVVDLPKRPVSLQGVLQRELQQRALSMLSESSLGLWEQATEPSEKAKWMERAKAYRAQLAERVSGGESAPAVLMLDARIALGEERYQAASAALQQYNQAAPGDQAEVLRLLARALIGENQLGAARQEIERLLLIEPDNTQAILLAAEIDRRLLEPERAVQRLEQYLRIEPDNEAIADALTRLRMQIGVAPADDAVAAAIIEARRILASGEVGSQQQVVEVLEQSLQSHPNDMRLLQALIEAEASRNNADKALEYVEMASALEPENTRLDRIRRRLLADDPVEFAIELIDESDAPAVERYIRKHAVLLSAGRREEAQDMLRQAEALNPDHPFVLELRFQEAIVQGRYDDAERLLPRAAAANADDVGGLLFEALLQQARGQDAEAVATLERVLQRLPYSGRALQMLGYSQLRLGRVDSAVQSLRRSFEARPDDIRAARALVGALVQLNRNSEALAVATRSAELNPQSQSALRLRLELEELAGDPRFAIDGRRRILRSAPDDFDNRIALIRLYTTTKQWDDARALIDETRQMRGDSMEMAMLEARWHGEQGRVDAGRDVLVSHIDNLGDALDSAVPHLGMAEYLLLYDRGDEAVAAMEEARRRQSPQSMEADRELGDYFFNRGDYAAAAEPYARVVESGTVSDINAVRKRLAETYTRLARWDDAASVIGALQAAPGADRDVEVLLLRAEVASGREQTREAQRLVDEAVRVAPNNPMPFLRRAQMTMRNPDLFNETMSDLDQALRLQPASVVARRMKSAMLMSRGRTAEAVAELRRAVETNPDSEELRATLISHLLETRAWSDAMAAVDKAIERSGGAVQWLIVGGDVYIAASDAPENTREADRLRRTAARHLRRAYEIDGSPVLAVRLLNTLLAARPPEGAEALRILDEIGEEELTNHPALLLLRSRALRALGRTAEMEEAATQAYAGVTGGEQLRLWFIEVSRLFSTPAEAAQFAQRMTPAPELEVLHEVRILAMQMGDVGRRSEIIARLRELEPRASDEAKVDIYRTRSVLEYQGRQFEDVARTLAAGRRILPDDREFNNNLAYVLAKHLNRPQEALAPAETAAALAPNDPSVLDTLGWIYFRTDRIAQAEATLQRAVNLAQAPEQAAPANLHMAEVMLAKEEFRATRRYIERAQEALRRAPQLAEEYGSELESLIQRLNQAEEMR